MRSQVAFMAMTLCPLSRGEGGTLNCAPSADAVAGNGRPLSYSLRSPSAHAVAGGGSLSCHTWRAMVTFSRIII
jgi:hypothetical protein